MIPQYQWTCAATRFSLEYHSHNKTAVCGKILTLELGKACTKIISKLLKTNKVMSKHRNQGLPLGVSPPGGVPPPGTPNLGQLKHQKK